MINSQSHFNNLLPLRKSSGNIHHVLSVLKIDDLEKEQLLLCEVKVMSDKEVLVNCSAIGCHYTFDGGCVLTIYWQDYGYSINQLPTSLDTKNYNFFVMDERTISVRGIHTNMQVYLSLLNHQTSDIRHQNK